jgi:hypothetical protein
VLAELNALPAAAAPQWLSSVGIPSGWRVGRYVGDNPTEPWSVAVRGQRADGTWDACETITGFGFTGYPEPQDVWQVCQRSLRELNADNIVIVEVGTPPTPGVAVISGSGNFDVDGRSIHGQFNYYAAGSPRPGRGRLIQQCLYVDVSRRAEFEASLARLGNELHKAFINASA